MQEKKEIVDVQEKIDFFDESIKTINEMLISSEEEFLHDIFIMDNDNKIYQSKKRM